MDGCYFNLLHFDGRVCSWDEKMSVLDGMWMDDIYSLVHFLSIWMDDIIRILHFLLGRLLMDEEDECIGWIIL
jgi:hypothetical protein